MSKEARVHLDTNTYTVPHTYVGQTVQLVADDHTVRVLCGDAEIARQPRCWDRRRHIEDQQHIEQLLARRPAARGTKRKDRLAALSPECRTYLQEVARQRINLESEIGKLLRLVALYGETEVAGGMAQALAQRTFGARYVRALIDQARFARGLGEPPEPVVTGNATADNLTVEPHDLETYDALFPRAAPNTDDVPDESDDPDDAEPDPKP